MSRKWDAPRKTKWRPYESAMARAGLGSNELRMDTYTIQAYIGIKGN